MQKPTVLILAGGENSRFFPLNTNTHKGALEICGKSLLERTVEDLLRYGFSDIVLVLGPKDFEQKGLSTHISDSSILKDLELVLQKEPKGMGDAVLCAREKIKDSFGVVFPSSLHAGRMLDELIKDSSEGGAIAVAETQEPWLYGIVTLENQKVTGIIEKPEKGTQSSNLYATGVYYLSKKYLDTLSTGVPEQYSFEAALDTHFKNQPVSAVKLSPAPSLKYVWHLFEFQKLFLSELKTFRSESAQVAPTAVIDEREGAVVIEDGARIGDFAKIAGPAYIGKNTFVGDFVFIRQSSLESGVQVGANTEVVRSILMANSELHFGYLADSVVGKNVRIGAGILTANKRHDRNNINVTIKAEKIDVGRNNLGVMIGHEAKIGVRTTTMPGVVIGAGAVIWPGLILHRNIEPDQVVKE